MSDIWQTGGASVVGSAHLRRNMPNQDAMAWRPDRGAGPRIVMAVSDGHGSAPHSRSATGAQLAVAGAAKVLEWHLDAADDDEIADQFLAADIVGHWQRDVAKDVAATPLSDEEQRLATGTPYIAYGATLLAMGIDETTAHLLQIGDGDMLFGFADGRITRPLSADEGLVGEETYSLCQSGAETHFRVATLWRGTDEGWPDFILLASDGVSKSFLDEQGFEDAARQLRDLAQADFAKMLAALPAWLTEVSANGSGDDSTLCFAIRTNNNDAPMEAR